MINVIMRENRRGRFVALALLLAASMLVLVPTSSLAVPDAAGTVIDDFNDNDTSDWGFFGGNNAGGGGGPLSDRPYEGTDYFSTGWGGQGSNSVFYGGAFKNLDNAAQVTPPSDPWFNVWVLNQSDATVDQYTLEITLREDLDGNGWTDGAEDSFRLDTTFSSAEFDDEWTLISAPLGAFTDLFTGGDGTFNGDLDEIVIVIAGVQGANPSTVEVDFDYLAFSSGGPLAFDEVLFDDMEHGDPFGNGWFSFAGSVGGGGINANSADLPPADGGAFSLETGWGSGGVPGFYGGFGRTNPSDLSGTDHFNFWINPDGGQDYTLEINLQEDDNCGRCDQPTRRRRVPVQLRRLCGRTLRHRAGGGWQLVSIPLDDFFDDNSFLTGGNGVLDPIPPARGGNGELINVVIAVIGNDGSDVNFRTDYWTFTAELPVLPAPTTVIDDFESGVAPGTPCPAGGLPLGFCTFNGAGSSVVISNPATPPAPTLPAVGTPNSVLQMDVDVTSFAGFIHGFTNSSMDTWVPQDWSTSEGFSLWFHGNSSGTTVFIDILDNRNPGSTTDDAERWTVDFVDDFTGWQLLEFPFSSFVRKDVGNGAPNDGLNLFEMHGYAIGTLGTGGPQTYYVDEVSLYGVAEPPALAVNFALTETDILEGTTGDVGVKLNRPMGPDDPAQVSIDYTTEPASAVPGEDYTPTSGTLTFDNGGPSELTFPVETFDNSKFAGDKRIILRLSNPVDVERGAQFQAAVRIEDDEQFDPDLLDDFEQGAFLWDTEGPAELDAVRTESSDADARPGQDAVENVGVATLPRSVDINVEGAVCNQGNGVIPVQLLSTPDFDATTVDHTTVTLGDASETHVDKKTGLAKRHEEDVDGDGDTDLVFHFRFNETGLPCNPDVVPFNGATYDGQAITAGGSDAALVRDFPIGQDWTGTESLSFWYHGAGGGEEITVTLKDNRAPDPGPSGWTLAWSDEFDEPCGGATRPGQLELRDRRRHRQRNPRMGQLRVAVLHGRPGQLVHGRQRQPRDHPRRSRPVTPVLLRSVRVRLGPPDHASQGRVRLRAHRVEAAGAGRRRRTVAGVLEPRHRHHLQPVAGCGRDRLHGVRQPSPERDLRHDPRPRLQRRQCVRRHLRLRRAGVQQLPHVHRRVGAKSDHVVRRRHPVPPGRAVRRAGAVGVREAVLPVAQLRHRRQLRWPGRSRRTPTRRSTWSTTSGSIRVPTPPSGSRPPSPTARRAGSRCRSR